MYTTILTPIVSILSGRLDSFTLVWQTAWKKENSEFNSTALPLRLVERLERELIQWSGRPGFSPKSSHTKDSKNGT